MGRKRKNNSDPYAACQYKNFHSSNKSVNKQNQTQQTKRNHTKRYFEHDTRTTAGGGGGASGNGTGTGTGTGGSSGGGGGVKRIKFNNEISIYESNESRSISSAAVNVSVKKRSRNKSTKQLQKQLIETQKRLQRQLIELQQHQHNSFLALLCATECNNPNHLNNQCPMNHNHNQCTTNSNNNKNQMLVNACTHFTANHHNNSSHECNNYDSSSLSNKKFTTEKMANGINRSLIPCSETSNVEFASTSSAKTVAEIPCKFCATHAHCRPQRVSQGKSNKPAIKSIILNASSQPLDSPPLTQLKIKQEPVDDESEMSHMNVPNTLTRIEQTCKGTVSLGKGGRQKYSFTPPRDSSQLKTKEMLGKMSVVSTDYRLSPRDTSHSKRRSRQKSPARPHSSRRKSKSVDRSSRSRSSDSDRYSRRRSSSRESTPRRSRSRRSESRSRSRSRHSRDTRSYGSTTSTSSSDSDRRSSNSRYREHRGAGDSKRSIDYHVDTNSRGSQSKRRSKSPAAACDRKAFNYQNSIMSALQRNNARIEKPPTMTVKRFTGAPFVGNQGPETSKKYAIKPPPIVKLHSEPGTDSDDDGKIEREYEELLTFETNEDERREQRLLKVLSDIAAKAKQKIQSITSESNCVNSVPPTVNNIHHDVCVKTTNAKPYRNIIRTASNDKSNDRRSTSYHNDDYSPKSKHLSRRSRKDDDGGSSKVCKSPRSSRSPSIPRRRGSPSFLDRRRITSARKKPIPYQRVATGKTDDEWNSSDKD